METTDNAARLKNYFLMCFYVVQDFKVIGLIILNALIIYMGTWDTVIRPGFEQMQVKDLGMEAQKKVLVEKQGLYNQYNDLEKQLQVLTTELIPVSGGNSPKVISVTEAAELLELAKGHLRDEALPSLLPPHDQRTDVSLTFTASSTVDLLKGGQLLGQEAAAAPVKPPEAPVASPGATSGKDSVSAEAAEPARVGSLTLPAEKYDYDLKVTGTYPALMDVLNELVMRKKLVRINKVAITRSANQETQPDPKDFPDFPVRLDMVVSLSLFLYASVGS
jgi:hypothetical protein